MKERIEEQVESTRKTHSKMYKKNQESKATRQKYSSSSYFFFIILWPNKTELMNRIIKKRMKMTIKSESRRRQNKSDCDTLLLNEKAL